MATEVEHLSAAEEAWALMSQLFWELRPWIAGVAAEFGLTAPQILALKTLDPNRPMPMGELAAQLHCDSSNVTGLVDRLTAQGLVERREAPHDRRVRMLAVTATGAAVRERLRAVLLTVPPALARLPEPDQLALRDVMRRALGPDRETPSSSEAPG